MMDKWGLNAMRKGGKQLFPLNIYGTIRQAAWYWNQRLSDRKYSVNQVMKDGEVLVQLKRLK